MPVSSTRMSELPVGMKLRLCDSHSGVFTLSISLLAAVYVQDTIDVVDHFVRSHQCYR